MYLAPEEGMSSSFSPDTPDSKWQGWLKDFFGFEISDFRIFLGKENFGKYFFG